MRAHPGRAAEQAFTLIEMMVAMVLLAVLLVIGSTVLLKTLAESSKSKVERNTVSAARTTFTQFGSDVRNARAPDRDPQNVPATGDLSKMLLQGKRVSLAIPGSGQPPVVLDVRDVIEATGSSFTFRSEVMPAHAGVECVRYFVRPADQAFVRQVLEYTRSAGGLGTCGTQLAETVLMQEVR